MASFPAGSLGPGRDRRAGAAQTRTELVRVLGEKNLVLQDSQVPFRPPEDADLHDGAAGRLPGRSCPTRRSEGFIVVYEFPDPTAAAEAAADAGRVSRDRPGRVQSPFGTRHVMRLVGLDRRPVLVGAGGGHRRRASRSIQTALETLGIGVPIPS